MSNNVSLVTALVLEHTTVGNRNPTFVRRDQSYSSRVVFPGLTVWVDTSQKDLKDRLYLHISSDERLGVLLETGFRDLSPLVGLLGSAQLAMRLWGAVLSLGVRSPSSYKPRLEDLRKFEEKPPLSVPMF